MTASVGAPRIAAIERPLGYQLGQPGDRGGQTAVLRATLQALLGVKELGSIVHLPFEWPAAAEKLNAEPAQPPPIVRYLLRHPWHVRNLFSREVPGMQQAAMAA